MYLSLLLFLFFYWFLANGLLSILILVFMTKCFGATIVCVELGIGPHISGFKNQRFSFALKLFPCNFEIDLLEKDNLKDYPELKNHKLVEDLSIIKQIILNCPLLILFSLSSLLLIGGNETVRHILSAPHQIFLGVIEPTAYAQRLLTKFDRVVESSCLTAWGILNAKMFFLQLLPSPNFDLFRVIWVIRKRLAGEREIGIFESFVLMFLFFLVALVFIVWLDALLDFSFDFYPGGMFEGLW